MTGVAMDERFALDPWTTGSEGLPVLEGALANLQGRIVETGSHDALVGAGGVYAALYRSWLGNTGEPAPA